MCSLLCSVHIVENSSGATQPELNGPDPVAPIVEVFNVLFGCLLAVCQALTPECAVVCPPYKTP